VASQGQRFRRRALRRGYKVDEVDAFLDRVEATLNGETNAPVTASEVHDVVFRVRFGGYDEWQVDLHLDRVERQLGELEERGGFVPNRGPDRMGPQLREDRALPMPPMRDDRMMPPMRDDRMMPPMRDDRPMAPPPPPIRPTPPAPAPASFGRFDEPPPRFDEPPRFEEPARFDEPPPRFEESKRFDDPTTTFAGGATGGFPGFEPGRHGKMDMTTEIRMPADLGRDLPPPPAGEAARIDQLRRTFQPRRFGSGYDPAQVDRLFDGIIQAVSSRSPAAINDSELDPGQFNLVPGGYFEAEVDQALREVRDILRRR
jgi:DivIVA domain-containing protein